MKINKLPYSVEVEKIELKPGCWNILKVKIFQHDGDKKTKIGEYDRNYHSMMNSFHPFIQDGKHYALYSKDYTSTRVMRLPECVDIAGEEPHSFGFCPTGYAVPEYNEEDGLVGQFGFMCGCVWGDDSSWKIQYLDLSKIEEGILIRDDRFGYIELLGGGDKLADAIDTGLFYCGRVKYRTKEDDVWVDVDKERDDPTIRVSGAKTYNLKTQHSKLLQEKKDEEVLAKLYKANDHWLYVKNGKGKSLKILRDNLDWNKVLEYLKDEEFKPYAKEKSKLIEVLQTMYLRMQ